MTARAGERPFAARGGVVGGIVGGLALSVVLMVATAAAGGDLWTVLKGASAPFYGARAAQPGFDAGPVLLGVILHFVVSIGWGVLFGILAYGLRRGPTLAAGALYGIFVYFAMFFVVLPLVGLGEARATAPDGFGIFAHVLFGLFTAIGFMPYQRPRPPLDTRVQRPTRGGRDLEDHPAPPL